MYIYLVKLIMMSQITTPLRQHENKSILDLEDNVQSFQAVRRNNISGESASNDVGPTVSEVLQNDVDSNEKQTFKSFPRILMFLVYIFIWYSSSVLAVVSSKKIMNSHPLPFSLCSFQFLTSAIISWLISIITNNPLKPVETSTHIIIGTISVIFALGFIFMNFAYTCVNASFVEIIRSSEPIPSVILGYHLLKDNYSIYTYSTLLPICIGVALACYGDISYNHAGFIFANISNFCFSFRAVLSKNLFSYLKTRQGGPVMDELSFYYHICVRGVLLLLPVALITESRSLHDTITGRKSTDVLISISYWPVVGNAIGYFLYNFMSYVAMSRTDLITHAVLNVFRRVFVIIFSCAYFNVPITYYNACGIGIACCGVILFSRTKK